MPHSSSDPQFHPFVEIFARVSFAVAGIYALMSGSFVGVFIALAGIGLSIKSGRDKLSPNESEKLSTGAISCLAITMFLATVGFSMASASRSEAESEEAAAAKITADKITEQNRAKGVAILAEQRAKADAIQAELQKKIDNAFLANRETNFKAVHAHIATGDFDGARRLMEGVSDQTEDLKKLRRAVTSSEALTAARQGLESWIPDKDPEKTHWGRVSDAKAALATITPDDAEYAEAQKLTGEVARRTAQIDMLGRKVYAELYEQKMLSQGWDMTARAEGSNKEILRLNYVLFNRPFIYKAVTEQRILVDFWNAGFKKVIFDNGDASWTYFNEK